MNLLQNGTVMSKRSSNPMVASVKISNFKMQCLRMNKESNGNFLNFFLLSLSLHIEFHNFEIMSSKKIYADSSVSKSL